MKAAKDRLNGLHPDLVKKIFLILIDMEARGLPMRVTDGTRTLAEQQYLYSLGRTRPGKRVTNADGVRSKSNHQIKVDGYGHAVDMTFINKQTGQVWWPDGGLWTERWRRFGMVVVKHGLKWGGNWKRPDRPHVEL
jgi:peptidoglycan L-alanyl-D-glutamate endopeptidase CwlK